MEKTNKNFTKLACDMLTELGAKKVEDEINTFRTFVLNTSAGELTINVRTDNIHGRTIFSRFKNVGKAKKKFDCNPHSGKYNIHLAGSVNTVSAVNIAKNHFEKTL